VRANYPGLNFELGLVAPRTFLVHVVTNVKQPGAYTAKGVERVSALLTRAGGTTTAGSRRRIQIKRKGGDVTADLVMYELTGDTKFNPFVLDGDVISAPTPEVTVTVVGAVRRPGSYELIKDRNVAELLELAGGFTSDAAKSLPLRVVRRNPRHESIDVPASDGSMPTMALRDGDLLQVRTSDELQRSVLLIGAVVNGDSLDAATTSKRLPYLEGDTVLSLVERAGGISAPGDLQRAYISRPRSGQPPSLIPLDLEALFVRRDFKADKPV